ncbi:MAG TPA: hypothetical protein VM166_15580 [Gemmatimonadaceae bacterium]|nr:hypothetical protein [Gemmatimonadaceae bacterium]
MRSNVDEIHIGFGGAHVTCCADADEIVFLIRQAYWSMLGEGAGQSVEEFEVRKVAGGYSLSGRGVLETTVESSGQAIDWLRPRILAAFMKGRPDLLWLHAGVVRFQGFATLIVGPSGSGKSTLSTKLCQLGWEFLSDEVAPLGVESHVVVPYPQSPFRRVNPGTALLPHEVDELRRELWQPPGDAVWSLPTEVNLVVFPEFSFGSETEAKKLGPGDAAMELLKNSIDFFRHREAAVSRLVDLAAVIPCHALQYGDGTDAAEKIDAMRRTIYTCRA